MAVGSEVCGEQVGTNGSMSPPGGHTLFGTRNLVLSCLGLLVLPTIAIAQPQSFPLVCRGGGNMPFEHRLTDAGVYVTFSFTKGNAPAGSGTTLAPGSCSWIDRGLTNDEPNRICPHKVQNSFIAWRVPGVLVLARSADAPYLEELSDPARTSILQVYQRSEGTRYACFAITGFGP
jgi:hypothetical protein